MTSSTVPAAAQSDVAASGERPYVVFGYGSLIFKVILFPSSLYFVDAEGV